MPYSEVMPTDTNATPAPRWTSGLCYGLRVHATDFPYAAVITPGIDGGWTLDRDVRLDLDLENFPTLAAAKAALAR